VLAPQGLVVREAPVAPATPAVPDDETVSVAPEPHRPPAAKRPAAPVAKTPLPTQAVVAAQPIADRLTGFVRLSVRSVAVAPNAASKPELLVKMGIEGAKPDDAVPETVTLRMLPQVPASVPKDDPRLALTARVDMVEAPRAAPTDPALRMRVRMRIAPVEAGTPTVQDPGPGDGRSNVIALTVSLDSFSDTPKGGTPDQPSDPEQPGPVDPEPEQPGSGGPTPEQPVPVDPEPEQPGSGGPTPEQPGPVTPQPTPIPPVEIILPVGPVRPNTETTTVPITPGTGEGAPPPEAIPVDIVVEELPPDEPPPPGAIPVDVVLEELPPDEPPAGPADVPTPGIEEPAVDVPQAPSDDEPESGPDTSPTPVEAAPDVSGATATP
jgi:hypothetical protein